MRKIKLYFISIAMICGVVLATFPMVAMAADEVTGQNTSEGCSDRGFLGFPAWYRGLTDGSSGCNVNMDSLSDLWTIALNIIEMAMMIMGYVSVAFVIYGGFLLITGRGKPDEIANGQKTIRNAVIGLVISIAAISVVNFVVGGVFK